MTWRIAAAVAPSLMLGACVYHLDTAIPEGQSKFESRLVGTWIAEGDTAIVTARSGSAYRIEYRNDEGDRVTFHGLLGSLGDRTVLEVVPLLAGTDSDEWPTGRLLFVVTIAADQLTTQALSVGAMRAAAAKEPAAIPHLMRGDEIILTAPGPQLITTLRAQLDRPGALDAASVWRRSPVRP